MDKEFPGISISQIEESYREKCSYQEVNNRIRYLVTDNFPQLGLLTALRFLEWTTLNPEGVVSLPTGKTPEYFIKWTEYLLSNWKSAEAEKLRDQYSYPFREKPDFSDLKFVQIDEFYPISSSQHNSFYYYVNKYYIDGFGFDRKKSLLINSDEIPLPSGMHFSEIFPDNTVDLSLRDRQPENNKEQIIQQAVFLIDEWCMDYEKKIRDMGGIGFFLGGIGPDGHIAFNTRGSSHYSTTRLTSTNFETQAVSAADLGGIESARSRAVITIGLETITWNSDASAVIIAAGSAKSSIVKKSIESKYSNIYPATVLSKLKSSCFYLTKSAASELEGSLDVHYDSDDWNFEKTERAVFELCRGKNIFAHNLSLSDLNNNQYTARIPDISSLMHEKSSSPVMDTGAEKGLPVKRAKSAEKRSSGTGEAAAEKIVSSVTDSFRRKISKGMHGRSGNVFLHTGPHHDDIMLGLLPYVNRQLYSVDNKSVFAVLTSGFTSVTNNYLKNLLEKTRFFISSARIEMINYDDFFDEGYKHKRYKDIYSYLNSLAARSETGMERSACHRIVRSVIEVFNVKNREELSSEIEHILLTLSVSYDGEKDIPEIQKLKGMIREFEEELVWAHSGVELENIHHLRLGFYQGNIFTETPEVKRDVTPFIDLFEKTDPDVLTLVIDPEGSGPDTHYKVLQVIAEALRIIGRKKDLSALKIIGYRNIWYRFHPSEADIIVPVSLNSLSVLRDAFASCYKSQVNASFPSYEYDGPFSELAQKIWAEQLSDVQLLLGKDYFYQSSDPLLRSAHGLVFLKEMNVEEFLKEARALQHSASGELG